MESNKLKKSYYKLFWSNQVGNRVFSEGFSEVGAVFCYRIFAQPEQVGLYLNAEVEEIQKEDILNPKIIVFGAAATAPKKTFHNFFI